MIDNYDAFVSVSSDAAMSQFVLGATWYAGLAAAELGDGSYRTFLDELGEEPLSKAVAYDLARDPESVLDPERMRRTFLMLDLVASEDWAAVASEWERRIAVAGTTVDARTYSGAARDLARSPEAAHQALALEYSSRAYALDGGRRLDRGGIHRTVAGTPVKTGSRSEWRRSFELPWANPLKTRTNSSSSTG